MRLLRRGPQRTSREWRTAGALLLTAAIGAITWSFRATATDTVPPAVTAKSVATTTSTATPTAPLTPTTTMASRPVTVVESTCTRRSRAMGAGTRPPCWQTTGTTLLADDGDHPNAAGNKLISAALMAATPLGDTQHGPGIG